MPNAASRTRITPASPPGPITVPARTVESYCSYTQRFDATGGWSSRRSSASAGLGTRDSGLGRCARRRRISGSSSAAGEYTGQSSISRRPGISTTTCSFQVARYMPSSVTRPIGMAVSSHFAAMAWTCCRRSALATTSIRSWDSESRISYGVIPGSRVGTRARSISTPTPPRAAISAEEEVRPAAPMSWIATMWPEAISSRLASSSSFSVKGSPTCTCGRRPSLSCVSSSEANAVAVVAHAAHHTRAEIPVARISEGPEAQAVEQRHRPGAHREYVAQNAADAGRRPLIGLHRGRVVMGLDFEGDRPTAGQPQHTGVLAGPLDDLGAGGGERLENGLGVLVGAMLAPQRGEHAQLGEAGRATQQRLDAVVLLIGQIVIADQLRRDRRVAREGGRRRHVSDAFAPETPRSTARNTRAIMFGSGWASAVSASPASNQMPWQ